MAEIQLLFLEFNHTDHGSHDQYCNTCRPYQSQRVLDMLTDGDHLPGRVLHKLLLQTG